MVKKQLSTYKICTLALLTAMMVLLSLTLALRTEHMKISFGSLPVVLAAMMFGPLEGAVVAVLGEFMVQLLTYGLVPTTPIWILPPALRALAVGGAALWLRRSGGFLENRPVILYVSCVAGAILTTTGNTFGMWLESLIYGTSFAPAALLTPARYGTGVVTALIVATVCAPLMHLLRRSGALNKVV